MTRMRFIESEDKFLEYSWNVYKKYFNDLTSFKNKYSGIDSLEKKNNFLRLASYYYFFVLEGSFSSPKNDPEDLLFVDQTYKFVALVALIESMYNTNDYKDFYQWIMKNKKNNLFPINTPREASCLYAAYKDEYGNTLNIVRFFQSLDDHLKNIIQRSLKVLDNSGKTGEFDEKEVSIEALAKLLYQIRSDFVHKAELILEFDPSTVFSFRDGKPIICSIELKQLLLIFESGLLQHFGIVPDKKQI